MITNDNQLRQKLVPMFLLRRNKRWRQTLMRTDCFLCIVYQYLL